jgi:hypothetical protein
MATTPPSLIVNGIDLTNPTYGWTISENTAPIAALTRSLTGVTLPGRNGVVMGIPTYYEAPTIPIAVFTPRENAGVLIALFTQYGSQASTLVDTRDPTRAIDFELASTTTNRVDAYDNTVELILSIRLSGVFWRDVTATSVSCNPIGTTNYSNELSMTMPWTNQTAPVGDATVSMTGPFTTCNVHDVVDGSGFIFNSGASANETIVYNMATMTAVDSSTGNDVSNFLEFIGYRFQINPRLGTAGTVAVIAPGATSATTVTVTGLGAYVV